MSPMRRDAADGCQVGPSWESLVERLIREAAENGAFDDLPYQGKRIPIEDDGSEWALAHHVLRQARMAPPWIDTDGEIRRLFGERDELIARAGRTARADRGRDRERLARIAEEVDRLVFRLELEGPPGLPGRRRLDLAQELARLDAAGRGDRPGSGQAAVSAGDRRPPDREPGGRPSP